MPRERGHRELTAVDVLRDLLDVEDAPAENEALRAWVREHGSGSQAEAGPAEGIVPAALPVGRRACSVCRKPGAAVCLRCESVACRRHHHVMYGLCERCMSVEAEEAEDAVDPHETAVGGSSARPELDVDWVDD